MNVKKRFYKSVSLVQSGGQWELNLDQRKLKTPLGSAFQVGPK
jgi:chaperone required for assembly of F1-ATPase